jgi:hypothetical protein
MVAALPIVARRERRGRARAERRDDLAEIEFPTMIARGPASVPM